ncbi:MED7-domain-containing protein [Hesseltinella vesiculosa]|uniref:Mediator of RNA polymerase II transcription subunit 7 n=1 Tax=Hesseltinella vesiculosa TaxID=101127 RepID=A0A1X2GUD5_9FUNG|nr:MED7-domain-containing protein [Hesseltinella vesiculosa]
MEEHTTGSAWPDPPIFYKRYTDANLEKLKKAKESDEYPPDLISQPPLSDFTVKQLEPPLPPTDAYTVFDQQWQVSMLNRTLIVQFLDLLDVLVKKPEEYGKRIENISTIFINMHHILNEYRPHQARETLRLLMEEQLERKRMQTEEIKM